MDLLLKGYRHFLSHVYPQNQELYARLSQGQNPRYLFITCSDSRVDLREFTGAGPGDLFVDRSLGNIVPDPGGKETEATAVIEYAVKALNVQHIIVCGHSQCGAMKALLDPDSLATMPYVAAWLENAGETLARVRANHAHLEGEALLEATIRQNVLTQVDRLRRQPAVADRLAAGKLQIHGWVFEFDHGRVIAYNQHAAAFLPLLDAYSAEGHLTFRT